MSAKLKNKSVKGVVTMKKLRTVAVYKDNSGDIQEVILYKGSSLYDYKLQMAKDLEDMGYKLIFYCITTDRKLFLSMQLKSALLVLRNRQVDYNRYIEERIGFTPAKVLLETKKLQDEHIETLMMRVGRLCAKCIREDIEVTDELAILCCDYREREKHSTSH